MKERIKIEGSIHYHLFRSPWAKIWHDLSLRHILIDLLCDEAFMTYAPCCKKQQCLICNEINFKKLIENNKNMFERVISSELHILCEDCKKSLKQWEIVNYEHNHTFSECMKKAEKLSRQTTEKMFITFGRNSEKGTVSLQILKPLEAKDTFETIKDIEMKIEDFESMIKDGRIYDVKVRYMDKENEMFNVARIKSDKKPK
ncbi:MAG: hypothetical protein ACOC2U_03265 [bacterium]